MNKIYETKEKSGIEKNTLNDRIFNLEWDFFVLHSFNYFH